MLSLEVVPTQSSYFIFPVTIRTNKSSTTTSHLFTRTSTRMQCILKVIPKTSWTRDIPTSRLVSALQVTILPPTNLYRRSCPSCTYQRQTHRSIVWGSCRRRNGQNHAGPYLRVSSHQQTTTNPRHVVPPRFRESSRERVRHRYYSRSLAFSWNHLRSLPRLFEHVA